MDAAPPPPSSERIPLSQVAAAWTNLRRRQDVTEGARGAPADASAGLAGAAVRAGDDPTVVIGMPTDGNPLGVACGEVHYEPLDLGRIEAEALDKARTDDSDSDHEDAASEGDEESRADSDYYLNADAERARDVEDCENVASGADSEDEDLLEDLDSGDEDDEDDEMTRATKGVGKMSRTHAG